VQKILIQEGKAVGAQFIDRNSSHVNTIYANKEVILAAGSTHSPQILQLSGVGPKKLLAALGLEQQVDLPGVGQNFQDHPTLYMAFECKAMNFLAVLGPSGISSLVGSANRVLIVQSQPIPNVDMLSTNQTYAADELALYWAKRQGPYTIVNQGGNTVAFLPLPDITLEYQSIIDLANSEAATSVYSTNDASVLAGYEKQRSMILDLYASTLSPVQETGWNGGDVMPVTLIKPLSRGSVVINSTDVLTQPLVDWGALTDPVDLETLIVALRINRALIASAPMQELTPLELSPGANVTSDEELRTALRELIKQTYSHPCCTCPMMPRELGGVVGPDLLVYGIANLSVVDASIMPMIPGTHLSATVYAVAEKVSLCIYDRACFGMRIRL
jgi:choline dehydrogenase-like flavoprotein